MKRIVAVVLCLLLLAGGVVSANDNVVDARHGVLRVICITAGSLRGGWFNYVKGTAFIIGFNDSSTFMVTNRHCVDDNFDEVYIVLDNLDGTVIKVDVHFISDDENLDLVILVSSDPALRRYKALPLAPANTARISDLVHALGFPGISDAVDDSDDHGFIHFVAHDAADPAFP